MNNFFSMMGIWMLKGFAAFMGSFISVELVEFVSQEPWFEFIKILASLFLMAFYFSCFSLVLYLGWSGVKAFFHVHINRCQDVKS